MKLYAPAYYKDFACIANRCRHSCCIGWEIDIDEKTDAKYADVGGEIGEAIRSSIERSETPHFVLADGERCPHLLDSGLCRIIKTLGEGYLCDICRSHPRFYNFAPTKSEVGLGIACEEACRLALTSDKCREFICIGEDSVEPCKMDFDAIAERESLYAVLFEKDVPYSERLEKIYEVYGVSPKNMGDDEWRELISSFEYLNESHRELFCAYSSEVSDENAEILARALAYFVFRHCTEAEDIEEYRASLGFCLFCERLLASLARAGADVFDAARVISEELEYSEDNTEAVRSMFL